MSRFRDKLAVCKHEKVFRYVLAFMLICSEMSYYRRLIAIPSLEPNAIDHLPITVCGWAVEILRAPPGAETASR